MATGRANQLTKQIGEYLVAAELGRRGLIAATFSGSVPDYDIVATDAEFRSVLIQVKAVTGGSWQFDIRRFVDVRLEGDRQVVGALAPPVHSVAVVMVALSRTGDDRFYILPWTKLQEIIVTGYQNYLSRHGGIRPKRVDSFHCQITENDLLSFKDAWYGELHERRGLSVDLLDA
ncbi:MAG TPA: hypothetical protein VIH18_10835 [Candidatus Binatia bacterium]|jgi:hypothetical protein